MTAPATVNGPLPDIAAAQLYREMVTTAHYLAPRSLDPGAPESPLPVGRL